MQKLISLILIALPVLAFAETNEFNYPSGVTLSGQLGYAYLNPPIGSPIVDYALPNFSARAALGYRFANLWGFEAGYNAFANSSDPGGTNLGPDTYKLNGVDLMLTKQFPLALQGLSVIGKIGAGYFHEQIYNQVFPDTTPVININTNEILPGASIGLAYNLTQNLNMGINYTHYQKVNQINNIDQLGLGLEVVF